MEYLAKHGFNVYAMDLRGTRESVSLGTPHPGSIKEFVEEDINSVVQYIQKRNKGKVYLIGHR